MVGGEMEVRLDGPDGKVIGRSGLLRPNEPQGGFRQPPPPPIVIDLEPTDVRHDLYLVVVSEAAEHEISIGASMIVVSDQPSQPEM